MSRIIVSAFMFDHKMQHVMMEKKEEDYFPLGGIMEQGATPEQVAIREVKKTAGLDTTHSDWKFLLAIEDGPVTTACMMGIFDYGFMKTADAPAEVVAVENILADPKSPDCAWIVALAKQHLRLREVPVLKMSLSAND